MMAYTTTSEKWAQLFSTARRRRSTKRREPTLQAHEDATGMPRVQREGNGAYSGRFGTFAPSNEKGAPETRSPLQAAANAAVSTETRTSRARRAGQGAARPGPGH